MSESSPDIFAAIQAAWPSLNPALQRVALTVVERAGDMRAMSIKDLAEACEVSQSSISRFVRAVGAPSFQQFRIRVAEDVTRSAAREPSASAATVYEGIAADDDSATILAKIARCQSDVLAATAASLSQTALEQAAALVAGAVNLLFFSVGSSCLAAEDALMRFSRIGKPAVFNRDLNIQMCLASGATPQTVAIGISDSGRTTLTIEALAEARAQGARTIALTSGADSPLAAQADVVLLTAVPLGTRGREGLYESMVSKIGQILAIDALYALVAVKDHQRSLDRIKHTDGLIARSRKR
jgi:RpiR family carbohydrate utilization transcriptional regulator